jgi:serine phosphatase RsbU (regulator of sigma subunit)/ligand-binding sensor domain-containing protein
MKKELIIKHINRIPLLKLFLFSFFFTQSAFIFAQENFVFENFSIPQGLSNPTINCIYEDKYGFLWLGTNDGLSRYDGYEFKVYKNNPSDSISLPGNSIRTISEDNNGDLWIGGSNVLAKYDRKNEIFIRVNFDREQNLNQPIINKIFIDKKNKIWIGTDAFGLHLLNPDKMTTKRIKFILNNEEIFNGDIFSIIETSYQEILALDYGSGIFYFNEVANEFHLYNNLGKNEAGVSLLVIHEDEFNRIWIGGEESLKIYYRDTKKLGKVEIFSKPRTPYLSTGIVNILKDKAGFLWLATLDDGLYRYNPVDNKFFHFTGKSNNKNNIKSASILTLFQDSFGNIWIGTRLDGLYKVDPNKQPMNIIRIPENLKTNSPFDRITSVAKSEKNNYVAIGTAGLGVFWQNIQNGDYKNYRFDQNSNSISSNNIFALTIDAKNNLWIGSDAGLDQINQISGKVNNFFGDQIPLYTAFFINDLKFDKAGRLFIAHRGGVDILYPNQNIVKKIPSVTNRELKPELFSDIINLVNSSQPIASILKAGEQKLLENEFEVSDSAKVLIIGVGEGQPNLEIMFDYGWLEDVDKNVIWGMHNFSNSFHFQGGMKNRIMTQTLQLKKGKYKLKFQSDVGHSYGNFNVLAPKDSTLWGIQVIRISDNQFSDFSKRIDEVIKGSSKMLLEITNSIFVSKSYENILWIGTTSQGLFKYNLSNGKFTQYNKNTDAVSDFVDNNDVYNILEDSQGIVWFSSPNGLGKLNPKTEEIKFFTEKDGLPTNLIGAIQEDNYGNLWISSAAGLTTLVRNSEGEKETFINIDIKDGLQGYSYSLATWKTNNGELFFGGDNGINYFIPGRTNQTKPKIVITDFKISDVSVFDDITTSPLKKDLNDTEELTLEYSQNDIAFQFSPIHYSRPERNLIAYKLEGFNKDWVYSKLHFASFTNLDPGEYTFRLKAANGDGIWSDEEKLIKIEILPPYWRTTLAYIAYGLFLVLGVFGVDRFQRRRLLAKTRERARIKESEMRAQIAEAENERKTKELDEARELQLSMLPKDLPNLPNLDIAVYMQTATEVGGDYYDFHVGMDGTLTVVVGDATGHGMKAGTMVTTTKSLFNILAPNPDILTTFSEISRVIKGMKFHQLSMCLMLLKIKGDQLFVSSAAMPPALIYRKKNRAIEEIFMKGMPLGAMNDFPYSLKESHLEKGDTVLLLTDGLPELTNDNNEMYGYDKTKTEFHSVGEKEPEEIVDHLKNSGSQWLNGKEPDDDVTFVVIKVK